MRQSKVQRVGADREQNEEPGGLCTPQDPFHDCSENPKSVDIEDEMQSIEVRENAGQQSPKLAAPDFRALEK
jgi:hypothetical protein